MDNIPEREQPKPEVVKPGQSFQLFKSENLVPTFYSNMQRRGFASSVNLELFSGYYESQPSGDVSEKNALEFSHFYPLDTGHLPQLPEEELIMARIRPYKGHIIGLPEDITDNMSKLSQIRARFVMVEEQDQQDQI